MVRFKHLIGLALAGALTAACQTGTDPIEPPTGGPQVSTAKTAPDRIEVKNEVRVPSWRVGSQWKYSDGYGMKVTAVIGDVTVFTRTDAPKQWFSRRGFLREESQSASAFRKVVYRTVKPDAGKVLKRNQPLIFTREYMSGKTLRVHATSWSLEGRETISVPAGQFDTWVIVMRTRSLKTDWTGFERWWYSPRAQNYVRMEYKYGDAPASSRVLESYSMPIDVSSRDEKK